MGGYESLKVWRDKSCFDSRNMQGFGAFWKCPRVWKVCLSALIEELCLCDFLTKFFACGTFEFISFPFGGDFPISVSLHLVWPGTRESTFPSLRG